MEEQEVPESKWWRSLCSGWRPCIRPAELDDRVSCRATRKEQDEPETSFLCHEVRKCSKNTRDMSKGHRSQCEGTPTGQISVMLMPNSYFPQVNWFLSEFHQWETESGLSVEDRAQGFPLFQGVSSSGGSFLHCYSPSVVLANVGDRDSWALLSLSLPFVSLPSSWWQLLAVVTLYFASPSLLGFSECLSFVYPISWIKFPLFRYLRGFLFF